MKSGLEQLSRKSACLKCPESWVPYPALHKPQVCNPSTQAVEGDQKIKALLDPLWTWGTILLSWLWRLENSNNRGDKGGEVWGHPWLQSEFKASLGYMRPNLKGGKDGVLRGSKRKKKEDKLYIDWLFVKWIKTWKQVPWLRVYYVPKEKASTSSASRRRLFFLAIYYNIILQWYNKPNESLLPHWPLNH